MVVEVSESLVIPVGKLPDVGTAEELLRTYIAPLLGWFGSVADVVLIHPLTDVEPAEVVHETVPQTFQSPAVSVIDVMFAAVELVSVIADPLDSVDETNSPTLPAFALSPAVVPTIPAVVDGVIDPVAWSVVNLPDAGVAPPMAGGAAHTPVLQVKPVPLVYCRMLDDVLQLGIANAVGPADDPVAFAITVLAAIAAIPLTPIPPHAGAFDAPVETMAWPLEEPVGLSN